MDKKVEFLKDWIERKMSKHDWFNGVKYVDIDRFKFRDKEVPSYIFYLNTGGFGVSSEFEDDFDSVFQMFFQTDENYDPTSVWEFRYV